MSSARKRNKNLVATLQVQVEDLTKERDDLKRSNETMRAQLDMLEQTNRSLLISQITSGGGGGGLGGFGGGGHLGGGAGFGLGGMGASGMLGMRGNNASLAEQLTMERIAAQSRLQAMHQAGLGSGGAGLDSNNQNGKGYLG